jgi:RimJ/RimL family protein N-acetyltransferase
VQRIDLIQGVYLSPVLSSDKAAYVLHFEDPSIARNLLRVPYPYTEADADWWIAFRTQHACDPETHFAIRRADGFLIGGIGLTSVQPDRSLHQEGSPAEIGYWIALEQRGRGLMPAAIQAFVEHCRSRLSLGELCAYPFTFNHASCRALEKAGFERVGLVEQRHLKDGQLMDAFDYRLR